MTAPLTAREEIKAREAVLAAREEAITKREQAVAAREADATRREERLLEFLRTFP